MKAHWWSCVLGLLCMPAEVMLSTAIVSQEPEFISVLTVNSSTEIRCFTTRPEPWAVNLHRGFHGDKNAVYLDYEEKQVTHKVVATEFTGRIDIKEDKQSEEGHGLTFELSLLKQEDTDWYYCSWLYYNVEKTEQVTLSSKGRIIIVKESEPQEQCKSHIEDYIFIALSVTALTAILFLLIGALIMKCKSFKRDFRPARPVKPSRPIRAQHVRPQPRVHHCPYLVTSVNTTDFRGIL